METAEQEVAEAESTAKSVCPPDGEHYPFFAGMLVAMFTAERRETLRLRRQLVDAQEEISWLHASRMDEPSLTGEDRNGGAAGLMDEVRRMGH